jgi:hypothetical protein
MLGLIFRHTHVYKYLELTEVFQVTLKSSGDIVYNCHLLRHLYIYIVLAIEIHFEKFRVHLYLGLIAYYSVSYDFFPKMSQMMGQIHELQTDMD